MPASRPSGGGGYARLSTAEGDDGASGGDAFGDASCWSRRVSHGWVSPILAVGNAKQLDMADLPRCPQLARVGPLLAAFDAYRHDAENQILQGADAIYQQAFDVLSSSKLLDALDVSKEDPKVRERYGKGSDKNVDDGPPVWNDQILICRRLIEVGVRCVTLGFGRWDYHGNNFGQMKQRLPLLDQGLSALVQDIHERGMANDVSVLVCSEFGRTPKINGKAGRDHWPRANCALLAGGGMKTGTVIGSTTPDAADPDQRPVAFQEIFATLYHKLGIDPKGFIRDANDRPVKLLDQNPHPLHELI